MVPHIRNTINTSYISGAQYTYIMVKSVESALHLVVGCIGINLANKDYKLATFLDIEGAFNIISRIAINES